MCVQSFSHVQLQCMNCSWPGSSVHGISQEGILEWIVTPHCENLPDPGIKPMSPASLALAGGLIFYCCATWAVSESQKVVIAQKLFDNLSSIPEA